MVSKGKGLNLPVVEREGGGGMDDPNGTPGPVLVLCKIAAVETLLVEICITKKEGRKGRKIHRCLRERGGKEWKCDRTDVR